MLCIFLNKTFGSLLVLLITAFLLSDNNKSTVNVCFSVTPPHDAFCVYSAVYSFSIFSTDRSGLLMNCCNNMSEKFTDGLNDLTLHHAMDNITYFLRFREFEIRENYRSFKIANASIEFTASIVFVITIFYAVYWILVFQTDRSLFKMIAFCVSLFPVLLMWINLSLRLLISKPFQLTKYRSMFIIIESTIIIGIPIGAAFVVFGRILYGGCDSYEFQNIWKCNPGQHVHGIPGETLAAMLFFPLLFKIIFPFVSFQLVAVSFVIGVSIAIAAIGYAEATTSIVTNTIIICLVTVTGYNYELHHMGMFLYAMRYHETLELRAQDFVHRTQRLREEMGNILSSICHDLKSPLSALSHGIELLRDTTRDFQEVYHIFGTQGKIPLTPRNTPISTSSSPSPRNNNKYTQPSPVSYSAKQQQQHNSTNASPLVHRKTNSLTGSGVSGISTPVVCSNDTSTPSVQQIFSKLSPLQDLVTQVSSVVENTLGCYQLVLMAVNRCSDYCKLIHFIPLVANEEEVNILEILQNAMFSIEMLEGQHVVELDEQPAGTEAETGAGEIHKNNFQPMIKTDRQWLQDNLLCLLLNAVKFSSGTMNRVKVYRTTFPSEDAYNDYPSYSDEMTGKEMLRIEVRDEGTGIGCKGCQTIFEAPDFASQQRKQGGAGVGLYCLAERVKVLKGQFGVHSSQEAGKHGSMFWFTLPYNVEETTNTYEQEQQEEVKCMDVDFSQDMCGNSESQHVMATTMAGRLMTHSLLPPLYPKQPPQHTVAVVAAEKTTIPIAIDEEITRKHTTTAEEKAVDEEDTKEKEGDGNQAHIASLTMPLLANSTSASPFILTSSTHSDGILLSSSTSISMPSTDEIINTAIIPMTKEMSDFCDRNNEEEHEEEEEEEEREPTQPQIFSPRILVVDDSLPILKMLKIMFERQGYTVDTAKNGLEAVQAVKRSMHTLHDENTSRAASSSSVPTSTSLTSEHTNTNLLKDESSCAHPHAVVLSSPAIFNTPYESSSSSNHNNSSEEYYDCILMDLQMPVMDGFEAIRQIRELEKLMKTTSTAVIGRGNASFQQPFIPSPTTNDMLLDDVHAKTFFLMPHVIIAMSANSDSQYVQQAYEAGIDQFIPKPVNPSALRKYIRYTF